MNPNSACSLGNPQLSQQVGRLKDTDQKDDRERPMEMA